MNLGDTSNSGYAEVKSLLQKVSGKGGLIFLVNVKDAPFLFETVGRPDTGIKLSKEFMFSDWLMKPPSLIRLHSADAGELEEFRTSLLREITDAGETNITTETRNRKKNCAEVLDSG